MLPFLAHHPDEMTLLAKIVDQACTVLGHSDEGTKTLIAAHVTSRAARGEQDIDRLSPWYSNRPFSNGNRHHSPATKLA
jgi:hypothetical protein